MRTRCLSFHSTYRCRHSGECCRAGWDIEVEPHLIEAVRSGQIRPRRSTAVAFVPGSGRAQAGSYVLARTSAGECGFHNQARCSLQEAGKASALPSACRHFPRVYLRDARGWLLTLSHFCPTAASMLLQQGPATITEAGPPLALEDPIEGLDAREALPPLVRPGLLADMDGYAVWEEAVVQAFLQSPDAAAALTTIEQATERVREWTPAEGPMTRAVTEAFTRRMVSPAVAPLSRSFAIVKELTGPNPLMDAPDDFTVEWRRIQDDVGDVLRGPMSRYLAACAFGNWIAYRGQGLRSIVGWLRACHDVLRVQLVRHLPETRDGIEAAALVEPIRMADYLLVHTVDSLAFGRAAVRFERQPPT